MNNKNRDWIKDAVMYQIYPQSYFDTNGDGIGDLKGIISKLDYIKSLGINLIWLNPCFESPFKDAGYDVSNFYKIAPRYGTNKDMAILFREAHKRDMRVCLDLVAGHSSIECDWFQKSAQIINNKYSNYYIWSDHWGKNPSGGGGCINGYAQRNGNFLINFFWTQPALNYGYAKPNPENPWEEPVTGKGPRAVISELKNIMKFWLNMGCDGYRVDMASSLVKNDYDMKEVIKLWKNNLHPWIRKNYPYAVMVAEWGNPQEAVGGAGFDIDFMLHFGVPGYGEMFFNHQVVVGRPIEGPCYFEKAGKGSPIIFLEEYFKHYKKVQGKGHISVPTANHDFQRMNWGRTEKDLKIIYTFIFTWNSIPSLYYGDEIGMSFIPDLPSKEGGYTRTGTRTPMQWSKEKNAGFSTGKAVDLYLPIDPSNKRPDVASQEKNANSLLNFTRKVIALRKATPALGTAGALKVLADGSNNYSLIYLRSIGKEKYLIALNPSLKAEQVSLPIALKKSEALLADCVEITAGNIKSVVSLKGQSYGVFRVG